MILEGTHYFCWFWDLYKPFDYEPVLLRNFAGNLHVISRFHWKGTVVWTSPELKQGKPVLDFFLGVHTPLIITRKGWFAVTFNVADLTAIEKKLLLHLYIPLIVEMLQGRIDTSINETHGYANRIVETRIPEKYLFEPRGWKFLIVVGEMTDYSKLPPDVLKQ